MPITPAIPMNAAPPVQPKGPTRSTTTPTSRTTGPTATTPAAPTRTPQPTSAPFTPTPVPSFSTRTPEQAGTSFEERVKIMNMPATEQQQFLASGIDYTTWMNATPAVRGELAKWGQNLPLAGSIVNEQQAQYGQQQAALGQRNGMVDQFGNFQASQQSALQSQYNQGMAMATGRTDYNTDVLRQALGTDLDLLREGQYRNVDLAREGLGIDQNYLNTMRGVAGAQMGINQTEHGNEQQYLNAMIGQLNGRRNLAFEKYGTNDRYMAQQGVDNAKQYGFNARGYEQELTGAFNARETQKRGARSDAAARGAFGSAGFRDNNQDIMDQYNQQLAGANLGLDTANQNVDERDRAIGNNRDNLGLDYRGQEIAFGEQQLGYNRSHNNNNTNLQHQQESYRGTMAGYNKQGQELAQTGKALDSLAREYGIKKKDLKNGFDNNITKLGLDLADTQTRLEEMLNSGNAQLIQQGMNFMSQMMAYQ